MNYLARLISKVPFYGTAVAFVTSKGRLIIEYILIAAIVSLAGMTFTLWLAKNAAERDRIALVQKVEQLAIQNQMQDATIANLQTLREKDAEALGGLLTDYKQLNAHDISTRNKLKELEVRNEDVRRYLSQPLPASLACLLNGSCTDARSKGGTPPATRAPRNAVRTACIPCVSLYARLS